MSFYFQRYSENLVLYLSKNFFSKKIKLSIICSDNNNLDFFNSIYKS